MRSNLLRGVLYAAATTFLLSCADVATSPIAVSGSSVRAAAAPAKVLINQVYGGGGNAGPPAATFQNDFVELFNAGGTTQSLVGWSLQYASNTGNFQSSNSQTFPLSGSIEPGQYILVKMAGGATGAVLPVTADLTAGTNMSGTVGKIALVKQASPLNCGAAATPCDAAALALVVDLFGYGSANLFEGTVGGTLANNKSALRNDRCTDTNNNATDFAVVTPTTMHNAASTKAPCVVLPPGLGSVSVANVSVQSGSNVTLTAVVKNTNGDDFPDPVTLTWTAVDAGVAKFISKSDLDRTATFQGLGTGGSTTITVTATDGVATVNANPSPTVTVVGPLDHVDVSGTLTVAQNNTTTLTATLKDASGQTITDPAATFTWTSVDPATAEVNSTAANTAVIKGLLPGGPIAINVSATSNGVTKSASPAPAITVTGPPVIVPSTTIVSELIYDTDVTNDVGEAMEFEGNAGAALTGWTLLLYNGNGGAVYQTVPLSGTFPSMCDGRGVIVLNFPAANQGFVQNGAPDGWALVNPSGQVTEFRSYEGAFAATNGAASGLTSTSIGVLETNTTAAKSLQRAKNGAWFGPSANSLGACNPADTKPAETITLSGRTNIPLGMQMAFRYDGTDGSGNPLTAVAFTSSNNDVATVDQNGIVTGVSVGSADIFVTAPDKSQGKTTVTVYVPSGASGLRLGHNEEFGEPKDGHDDDDIIIKRDQYTVSYNPGRGGANWVSWNISASHITQAVTRCDGGCYSADTALTKLGLTAYTTANWVSNVNGQTGYDRGHMAPSADWTSSEGDNLTTFFLTNFLPQRADLNQGPWEVLEGALRDTVKAGREVYVIAGGIFTNGVGLGTLLDSGKIAIPDSTWKIAVITPAGTGMNADGTLPPNSNVLAVNMPNVMGIKPVPWQTYVTTVAKIERSTGYNFLDLLSEPTECLVEVRNCAPTARITGASFTADEGQSLSFSGSTSSDPNVGDVLTKQWYVNNAPAGTGNDLSYTFANDGSYQVKLIVTDNAGSNSTAIATVVIDNVAPSVGTFAGATVVRGQAYEATGSFTDPGADSWSGSVNFGDGSSAPLSISGKSFNISHAYSSLGTFTVTVSVNDGSATGTRTAMVQVNNVAPVVSAFSGATILRGETYASTGSFTDQDADSWSGTVSYGDGSSEALSISGHSFDLSHTYATAGTYTVVVTVNDGHATDAKTAVVTVKSATQGIADLDAMVVALGLNKGQTNSLQVKLDNAAKQIAAGNNTPAANMLNAFLEEISALAQSGRISAASAAKLTTYAQRVIASM